MSSKNFKIWNIIKSICNLIYRYLLVIKYVCILFILINGPNKVQKPPQIKEDYIISPETPQAVLINAHDNNL